MGRYPRTEVTWELIAHVRRLRQAGETNRAIAKSLGVSYLVACRISSGKITTPRPPASQWCEPCDAWITVVPCVACAARRFRKAHRLRNPPE